MKFSNIQHIFFDLDHTLWDFDKNSAMAFEQMFEKHRLDLDLELFLETYRPVNFDYWKRYQENRVTKNDLRYGRLKDTFDSLSYETSVETINSLASDYIEMLPLNNHLLEGAIEVLDELKANYSLHIITNGFEEVQHKKLKTAGISTYFESITTSEEAGVKKPNPGIFELAMRKALAKPESSLMVGDNFEADVMGAKNLGIQSVFFDYYSRDEITEVPAVKKLNELLNYL
ncbi:YjjG family noncanonical pyrimidine nucleotidase [Salegentibacter sp. HM20]